MPPLRTRFLFWLILLILFYNALYLLAETPSTAPTKPVRMAKKIMRLSLPEYDILRPKIQTYRSWISSRRMVNSGPQNDTLWVRLRNTTSLRSNVSTVRKAVHTAVELQL